MKPEPLAPASLISDGYTIDLVPWWRHFVHRFNPFRRRRRSHVPMDDAMILVDALIDVAAGSPIPAVVAKQALDAFTAKHQLP